MPLKRIVSLGVAMLACGWSAYSELVGETKVNILTLQSSQCAEIAKCLSQTIGKAHLGAPPQEPRGLGVIHAAAELLAWLARAMTWRKAIVGDVLQQLVEVVDAGLDAGSDVVRAGKQIFLQREYVCTSHVIDIYVVASLHSCAVYCRGFFCHHVAAEYGHYPRLSMWVLARPVDVGVA